MHDLVVGQAGAVLCICPPELLNGREVGPEVLDVGLQLQHACIAVCADHLGEVCFAEVGVDGPPGELLAHVVCLHHRRGLGGRDGSLRAPELLQEIQGELLVLLPRLLELVPPSGDPAVEFLQSPLLFLHLVDEVDLLALGRAGVLDDLVALLLELAEELVLLSEGLLQLVIRIQHHLGLVVQRCMLRLEACERLFDPDSLLGGLLRVHLGPPGVLHHVVGVEEGLLDVAPHILAFLGRLLDL
mmetsp:Transcript_104299/g.326331  ORF Transcript_104299/g.326331 Transcript_104299/m.326331 type:complete len:243 (-) Transcript_104299:305-1033(-)